MLKLYRILAVIKMAVSRVVAQRGMALATLLGLLIAIGLTISIPVYADAVYYRVLSEGLFSDNPRYRGQDQRPPISLLFRYVGAFTGPKQWHELIPLNTYLDKEVYDDLRLAPTSQVKPARLINTGLFGLFAERNADRVTEIAPDYQIGLAAIDQPEAHLSLIEGTLPPTEAAPPDAPLEVLMSSFLAEKMGMQVGETYIAYDLRAMHRYEANPARFELRVAGVWEPLDPKAEFWGYTQLPLDNMLFVSERAFEEQIAPVLSDEIYQASWYIPLDASMIYADDVEPLLVRLEFLKRDVGRLLPNTILDVSPVDVLQRYQEAANLLTLLLFAFSIPVLSLVLTFVTLVVALNVERQRGEVASLRSRGATSPQLVGIAAVESGLLGIAALAVALPVSLGIAYAIGQTRSFLDFSLTTNVRVGLTWGTARLGVVAMGITVLAQVFPLVGATRHTVVTYKSERARSLKPPWWQRIGLDLLLFIPAAYGTYLLDKQGSLLPQTAESVTDPFSNPLLFLLPALSLLVGTLIVLRILPLVTRAVAWLLGLTRNVGVLMASRQLSRAPGLYAAPLALLILTLGLSTYSASLAATLDNHLRDQQYYWVGADISLVDIGDEVGGSSFMGQPTSVAEVGELRWRFLPVSEYLKLPGITSAARIGRYRSRVQVAEGYQAGTYVGVDRTDFGQVAFWRDDFAREPLGALMNSLALQPNAVLLPETFMAEQILNPGDTINVVVLAYDTMTTMPVTVVGSFDYFPGWYPETGPLVVGNLDYLFQEAQTQFPYRVWLRATPEVDYSDLSDDLWALNMGAQSLSASRQRIFDAQRQPERQGLLGVLSVGFAAAAVLAALGFVLYALFSFKRRAVEMGVLRAIGLSTRHMAFFVGAELAILLLLGGAAGTGLGIWASNLYVPYLQVGAEMTARVPPYIVQIAWPALLRIYGLFGLLFLAALVILVRLLMNMKLFQAIKLGETI